MYDLSLVDGATPTLAELKELGVKQESLFYWCQYIDGNVRLYNVFRDTALIADILESNGRVVEPVLFSAFTVAELGEMLPREIEFKNEFYYWTTGKAASINSDWYYHYKNAHISRPLKWLCIGVEKTESNARAKMLIYLIENKLITF